MAPEWWTASSYLAVGVLLMVAGGFGKGGFLLRLLGYPIAIAYETYFVGRYGATLGKMACGLKVVRSEGQNVSYGTGFRQVLGVSVEQHDPHDRLHHGSLRFSEEGPARSHLRHEGDQDLKDPWNP